MEKRHRVTRVFAVIHVYLRRSATLRNKNSKKNLFWKIYIFWNEFFRILFLYIQNYLNHLMSRWNPGEIRIVVVYLYTHTLTLKRDRLICLHLFHPHPHNEVDRQHNSTLYTWSTFSNLQKRYSSIMRWNSLTNTSWKHKTYRWKS